MKRWVLPLMSIALVACSPYKLTDQKAGLCNELNSRMIFNGSTSNPRQAEIDNAQRPLIQSQYDKKCSNT